MKKLLMPSVPDPKFTFPGLFEAHRGNFQVTATFWRLPNGPPWSQADRAPMLSSRQHRRSWPFLI